MPFLRSRGLRVLLQLGAFVAVAAAVASVALYVMLLGDLPDFRSLEDYHPRLTTEVLDRHGRPIGEFYEQRRRLVRVEDLPEHVVLAFVAGEDDTFFEHSGLDYVAILRAAWVDLVSGEKKQGASTITMQTAKNLLLTPERAFSRKLKEMVLARRIEQRFTKDEILFLYLNEIYFGSGAWGLGEAARTYFGKEASELDLSEAALLAGLPKAPSRNSPFVDPQRAEERRRYVLRRMVDAGFVDAARAEEALAHPPELAGPQQAEDFAAAGYFTEEVRRALFERLGGDLVLGGGLTVHTTLDLDLQREAVRALRLGLERLDHRQGWRGPMRTVEPAALQEEIARLALENGLADGGEEEAAEVVVAPGRPGEETPAPEASPLGRSPEQPLVGVVTDVDRKAQAAWVAFGPGLSGRVALEDVSWAREPNPARYPAPVQSIDRIFDVGDVTRFVPVADEAEAGTQDTADALRVTLYQEPLVEGALLSLDVASGDVLALVGGYDFERSEFDRAVQAERQPGSAFKPLIYATALAHGKTPASIVHDRPVVYTDEGSGFTWRPENYGRRFLGPLTLREALARSVNNATIHLLRDVGVRPVIEMARRLGIGSPLEPNLSLALGSSPVTPLELTRAYAVFAAGGRLLPPRFLVRVEDRHGQVLLDDVALAAPADSDTVEAQDDEYLGMDEPDAVDGGDDEQILDPAHAYVALDLLRAVVEDPKGTGRRARQLGRPLAGKTGTTNDQADAWFVGFSADVATGVWVGYDSKRVLGKGETGGRAALPIWIDFMRAAHRDLPARDFPMPDGIVLVRIDRPTGLLADASSRETFFQAFLEGTEPTETASSGVSTAQGRRLRLEF
jgi:penicillin-binding protein 1A